MMTIYPNSITVDFEDDATRKVLGGFILDICEGYGFLRNLRGTAILKELNMNSLAKVIEYCPLREIRFIMEKKLYNYFEKITDIKMSIIEETSFQDKEMYLVLIKIGE